MGEICQQVNNRIDNIHYIEQDKLMACQFKKNLFSDTQHVVKYFTLLYFF